MSRNIGRVVYGLVPFVLALIVITGLLLVLQAFSAMEAGPIEVIEAYYKSLTAQGEISPRKLASVIEFWIPLTLVSMGLIVSFRAGLWNIGVEGQMAIGGLFAAGASFMLPFESPLLMIPAVFISAMIGGGLWALLAGVLKSRFGVNEIFSGVALNALANQITLQMIAGPWAPPGVDKAQYSRAIPEAALLPPLTSDFKVSALAIGMALAVVVGVLFAIHRTRWGLSLKATGLNSRSARLLGVRVGFVSISAIILCGALAGMGGLHRVIVTYEGVRAQYTGGIGFLGLLVVLLVNMRGGWVPIVAFLFALMLAGGTQLQFIRIDTSLTGVLQGLLVLLVILFGGVRDRLAERKKAPLNIPSVTPADDLTG